MESSPESPETPTAKSTDEIDAQLEAARKRVVEAMKACIDCETAPTPELLKNLRDALDEFPDHLQPNPPRPPRRRMVDRNAQRDESSS